MIDGLKFKFCGSEIIASMNIRIKYYLDEIENISIVLPEKYKDAKEKHFIERQKEKIFKYKNNIKKLKCYIEHIIEDYVYMLSKDELIEYELLVLSNYYEDN